jgi:hypothetical protein
MKRVSGSARDLLYENVKFRSLSNREKIMSATILTLDRDVAEKFKFAKAMQDESRMRMGNDPKAALDFAKASALKLEEALTLAREKFLMRDA